MSLDLTQINAVISDMDGVLWRGDHVLPQVVEFFNFLRRENIPFALATNNSGKHPLTYVKRLEEIGIPNVEPWQIITSGTATASYLQTQYGEGTPIYLIGMPGLADVMLEANFVLQAEDAAAVVAGIDFSFNYDKALTATHLIRNGAAFVGTNGDLTFPNPRGLSPGAGSILAMLEAATDIKPVVIGKPEFAMFEVALRRLGTEAGHTLMIGDRLNTDISGGKHAGLKTAFVLTGVHTTNDADTLRIWPDETFSGLGHLLSTWQNA